MNFFKRFMGKPADAPPDGSFSSDGEEVLDTGPSPQEAFNYEVRLVHLGPGGLPQVWKTRSVKADRRFIYLLPPPDWNFATAPDEAVTLYFITEATNTEFDAVVKRDDGGVYVKVDRPPEMEWRSRDGSLSNQKRKQVRIDVSLPAQMSIISSVPGGTASTGEPHPTRLIDLSIDGCSMVSNFEPPVDRPIEIKVLGTVFPLVVKAQVIRVTPSQVPSFRYNAAITFKHEGQVTRDMISRYVLDHQKEK